MTITKEQIAEIIQTSDGLDDCIKRAYEAGRKSAVSEPVNIDYTVLYEFAEGNAISYNKLCTAVNMAIATPPAEAKREPINMDDLPHQDWCRYWNHGDFCTCGADTPPAEAKPLITREQHFALREAFAIGAADSYFEAYPTHDNDVGRMLFERGFARGFDSHERAIETATASST